MSDMGVFKTTLAVAALHAPELQRELYDVMVDTGSEFNWIPSQLLAELGVAPLMGSRG